MKHRGCVICSEKLVYPSPTCHANAMAIGDRRSAGICLECCPTTSALCSSYGVLLLQFQRESNKDWME